MKKKLALVFFLSGVITAYGEGSGGRGVFGPIPAFICGPTADAVRIGGGFTCSRGLPADRTRPLVAQRYACRLWLRLLL